MGTLQAVWIVLLVGGLALMAVGMLVIRREKRRRQR
jgi:hypothetical protein